MSPPDDTPSPDRYISFIGLDCDAKAHRLVEALRQVHHDGRRDPFWDYFQAKLDGRHGPAHDELYHIHCHLNDLRDLLERWEAPALAVLLESLEVECC
jgi:hypothetical protein